jgi:hypothetical protein
MRQSLGKAVLALGALLLLPSCTFYFGDDDDDCAGATAPEWQQDLLNPYTADCESVYPPGGCGFDAPAQDDSIRDYPAQQDWAQCFACQGLSEYQCLASDGCRGLYQELEWCAEDGSCGWTPFFETCVGTAPSGPVRGGECLYLDAYECSRHDDCIAFHHGVPGEFTRCDREPPVVCDGGGAPPPAPPPLRDPESGQCVADPAYPNPNPNPCLPLPTPTQPDDPADYPDAGSAPTPPDGDGDSGSGGGADQPIPPPQATDWGVCGGFCETLGEADCKAADACRAIYANSCAPNTDCWIPVFEACWPTAPSGPIAGGGCENLSAYDCSRHNDCSAVHDSDWSACPDPSNCDFVPGRFRDCRAETAPPPPPPPACGTLDEDACIARDDCTPLYTGEDCSCSPMGCTCENWLFDVCSGG